MIDVTQICQLFNTKYISYLHVIHKEFQLLYNLLLLRIQLYTTTY